MSREFIGMRIAPEIIQAVDKMAELEYRSRSNTIEFILSYYFRSFHPEFLPEKTKQVPEQEKPVTNSKKTPKTKK